MEVQGEGEGVTDPIVNMEEEAHRERDVGLDEVENADTIDTDAVEELDYFIVKLRVVQESEKDKGEQLERLISTLPKTIGKCSQGHTKGQMLKALRQLNGTQSGQRRRIKRSTTTLRWSAQRVLGSSGG